MSARLLLLLVSVGGSISSSGCVGYDADPTDLDSVATELAARPGGRFDIDAALELALVQNPDLRRLEAEARAAAAAGTVPLTLVGEYRGRAEAAGLMVDPVALLGFGPRGGAIELADAQLREAVTALATERWRVMASVVECFVFDRALHGLDLPELTADPSAFEAAGLASPVAAAEMRAAQIHVASEHVVMERLRRDNEATLRRLLGLGAAAELRLEELPADWLRQPEGVPGELLDRPDLRLAVVRFEVADAAFRKAVAEQYPSFQVGPNFSLRGDPLRAMGMLQIPVGMDGLAAAARERREATREALLGTFLNAHEEAAQAEQRWLAAKAAVAASEAGLQASRQAYAAAQVALSVEPEAFDSYARAAWKVLRDLHEHRQRVVEQARATVQRAAAFGWPLREAGLAEQVAAQPLEEAS